MSNSRQRVRMLNILKTYSQKGMMPKELDGLDLTKPENVVKIPYANDFFDMRGWGIGCMHEVQVWLDEYGRVNRAVDNWIEKYDLAHPKEASDD